MPTMITLVDGTIPVAADFNSNYQALNNAIGSNTSISAWAVGEIPYASATNTLSRLTPGTIGQILAMGIPTPGWTSQSIGGCFLSNNGSDATNDIDVTVGARYSDDAAFGNRVFMPLTTALTKQLDAAWAAGTNQGMRDTGSIANGTWHIFLIMHPTTGVTDILASTSASSPTMPSGYTKKWRIGSILREGGVIVPFTQDLDYFLRTAPALDVNVTASNFGTSAISRTLSVPLGIRVIAFGTFTHDDSSQGTYMLLSDLGANDDAATVASGRLIEGGPASVGGAAAFRIRTNTSAQIRSRAAATSTNTNFRLVTEGWIDRYALGNV